MGRVRGYYRNRKWVRSYTRRNPGRRADTAKPTKGAGVTVAVAIGGIDVAVTISSLPGASASPPDRAPSVEVSAEPRAGFTRAETALVASGFKVDLTMKFGDNCAAHSYDRVHTFFQSNPCRWLARAYLAVSADNKGLALVALSWVGMSNASLAEKYKHLVDAGGTGNITELSYDSGPYRSVRYTGNLYMSGINGTAVWNAEVQPVDPTATAVLNKILDDSQQ